MDGSMCESWASFTSLSKLRVEGLVCTDNEAALTQLADLRFLTQLRFLKLPDFDKTLVAPCNALLVHFASLENLACLDVSGLACLVDTGFKSLCHLPKLTELHVSKIDCQESIFETNTFPHLRVLVIGDWMATDCLARFGHCGHCHRLLRLRSLCR